MTGIIEITPSAYTTAERTTKTRYFVDDNTLALAKIISDAGVGARVFDPSSIAYTPSTGIAKNLNAKQTAKSTAKVPLGTQINSPDVWLFSNTSGQAILSNDAKTETNWTIMAYVSQTSADNTLANAKTAFACGQGEFYIRNLANSTGWNASFNGVTMATFNFPAGNYILMVSYDNVSGTYSIRKQDDAVLQAGSASGVDNGNPWGIGGPSNAADFAGSIGRTLILDVPLHLPAYNALRTALFANMRAKYGL